MKQLAIFLVLSFQAFGQFGALQARFHGGKTFITFTEGTGSANTYNLYRSTSPITSVSGKTPYANIPSNSCYDPTHKIYHVITDSGAPLSAGTGLFVYSPKDTSAAYYAVTMVQGNVEGAPLTTGPVSEAYWPIPRAIINSSKDTWGYGEYNFEYWMDWEKWPKDSVAYVNAFKTVGQAYYIYSGYGGYERYGAVFTVYIPPKSGWGGLTKLPVNMFLHTLGTGTWAWPYGSYIPNKITFCVSDPNKTFFTLYTRDRIMASLRAFLSDPRFAAVVDTDRVILSGSSMGACGSFDIAYFDPEPFSVLNPQYASVIPDLPYYTYDFGHAPAIAAKPSAYRPPIVNFFGAVDGKAWGIYAHRYIINACESAHQGEWSKWLNVSHGGAPSGTSFEDQVPGGLLRFKKSELFPAFTQFSLNSAWGAVDSSQYAPNGMTNASIDWTSFYHDLGLPNDNIVDKTDTIAITFKALAAGAVADITPRRLQTFKPVAGLPYHWENRDVLSGSVVASGTVTADTAKLITIPAFAVSQTGSRLIITANTSGMGYVKVTVLDSAANAPLSGAQVTLTTNPSAQRTSDSLGKAVFQAVTGSFTLNLSHTSFVSKNAVPVTIPSNDTVKVTVKLSLLPVTGLLFQPDSFILGQSFTYKPVLFSKHSDNSLYPASTGVVWAATPGGKVSISGNAVTALSPGSVQVTATLGSFKDTLFLTVVDTAPQLQSLSLSETGKTIDANSPYPVHATGTYSKTTTTTFTYTLNLDSTANWTTGNSLKATVVKGLVTGHDSGSVAIVAALSGKSDTAWFTIRPTPSFIRRVNFQAQQNPNTEVVWSAAGWARDYGSAYSAGRGMGWLNTSGLTTNNDKAGTNFLLKSLVAMNSPHTFKLDAPDGQYIIRTAVGDNIYGNSRSWIAFGADTIMRQELTDTTIDAVLYKQAKYNKIVDDTITVIGGAGISLSMYGFINYLVVLSAQGLSMDLMADDDGAPDGGTVSAVERAALALAGPLLSAYPNPFQASVTLQVRLADKGPASYRIYDVRGRVVYSKQIPSLGRSARVTFSWDGRDSRGLTLPPGLYFGKLTGENGLLRTHKLMLMK